MIFGFISDGLLQLMLMASVGAVWFLITVKNHETEGFTANDKIRIFLGLAYGFMPTILFYRSLWDLWTVLVSAVVIVGAYASGAFYKNNSKAYAAVIPMWLMFSVVGVSLHAIEAYNPHGSSIHSEKKALKDMGGKPSAVVKAPPLVIPPDVIPAPSEIPQLPASPSKKRHEEKPGKKQVTKKASLREMRI